LIARSSLTYFPSSDTGGCGGIFFAARTAFQDGDVFKKNKGLVIESGIIGAAGFTTKVTKNTKQVTKRRRETSFVTAFVPLVSFVVKAASRRSDAPQG
jgi:hypothetical protein